jgi:DNA-binding SARP family transcriptional activator
MDELGQKEKEEAQAAKKANCEAFRHLLEADNVRYNAKWDDMRIQYKNNDIAKALHPYDRISTFVDYILDAEKKH